MGTLYFICPVLIFHHKGGVLTENNDIFDLVWFYFSFSYNFNTALRVTKQLVFDYAYRHLIKVPDDLVESFITQQRFNVCSSLCYLQVERFSYYKNYIKYCSKDQFN